MTAAVSGQLAAAPGRDAVDVLEEILDDVLYDALPFHHQVLFAILVDAGEIESGELHRRYDELAGRVYGNRIESPIGRRSRRNKLSDLRDGGLARAETICGPRRRYHAVVPIPGGDRG